MRRSIRAIPVPLAAAALLVLAPTAHAVNGQLIVDGAVYQDPSGCIFIGEDANRTFENNTEGVVTVFPRVDCSGEASAVLPSGDSGTYPGKSVAVG
ncbi:hypothetical protein [Nocardia sp. NPDC052566]|uniref:hypothetical protein n=1 Tax=Nocardia sp. NPDC052566 TaxID=3364330 RepID=UPI0037CA6973